MTLPMVFLVILRVLLLPIPTFQPLASPTPIPTYAPPTAMPTPEVFVGEVYNILATAERSLRDLPRDLRNPGLPLVSTQDGFVLFSYIKWLTATSTSDEIFSSYFAGFARRFPALIYMAVIFGGINLLLFIVQFLVRAVVWVLHTLKAVSPF